MNDFTSIRSVILKERPYKILWVLSSALLTLGYFHSIHFLFFDDILATAIKVSSKMAIVMTMNPTVMER